MAKSPIELEKAYSGVICYLLWVFRLYKPLRLPLPQPIVGVAGVIALIDDL